ncbi:hypothetical protein QBC34DRAFT_467555 [Podospora aff. communis PSN243]|uniref:REJ domain-containing protein n=1 Tax=Podospora aff. communis PSN243 TaxID=3040156 RepID=A0AAV9GH57_9PEZI|nr:hypothetical protein QBC34DRAFT_467555 [Podospora aff. communis PSN243]
MHLFKKYCGLLAAMALHGASQATPADTEALTTSITTTSGAEMPSDPTQATETPPFPESGLTPHPIDGMSSTTTTTSFSSSSSSPSSSPSSTSTSSTSSSSSSESSSTTSSTSSTTSTSSPERITITVTPSDATTTSTSSTSVAPSTVTLITTDKSTVTQTVISTPSTTTSTSTSTDYTSTFTLTVTPSVTATIKTTITQTPSNTTSLPVTTSSVPLNPPPTDPDNAFDDSRWCPWCSRALNLTNATSSYERTCHFFMQQPQPDGSKRATGVVMPYAVLGWDLARPLGMGMLRPDESAEFSIADESVVQWSGNRVETWMMGGRVVPPTLAFNDQVYKSSDPRWKTYYDTVSGAQEIVVVHHLDFDCGGDLPCALGGPCGWGDL